MDKGNDTSGTVKPSEYDPVPLSAEKSALSQCGSGPEDAKDASTTESSKTAKTDQPTNSAESYKDSAKYKRYLKRMRFQPKNVTLEDGKQHEYYKELLPEEKKKQFEIPRTISVMEHAAAAAKEIKSMMTAVKQHAGSKTALQILPRHMRRRAASHNVKRLPRRLRNLAMQMQAQSSAGGKQKETPKKVCRKKRRRHDNLQNEYATRAGKAGWLETHMWHAKRFHMSTCDDDKYKSWGCRVALFANDKSFRASYRATAHHCTIQDVSFMKVLEITGSTDDVRKLIDDVTMTSSTPLDSDVESRLMVYDKVDYSPPLCVSPIAVMKKPYPITEAEGGTDVVWMWIFPTAYRQTLDLLNKCRLSIGSIEISDISSELNRFRLTGPKSSVTLLSVLRFLSRLPYDVTHKSASRNQLRKLVADHNSLVTGQNNLLHHHLSETHRQFFNKDQHQGTPCRDGRVFSAVVDDPRLTLPLQKITPSFRKTAGPADGEKPADDVTNDSPLWNVKSRAEASASRRPDREVSTRANLAKFACDEDRQTWLDSLCTPVPVLVVRRGKSRDGWEHRENVQPGGRDPHVGPPANFGGGWDVVIPAKWSTAFWVPFIYNRARACGLRELERVDLERKSPSFPRDFPDTKAGQEWWRSHEKLNHEIYYKKPPSKRPNYSVLASTHPFAPAWGQLASGGSPTEGEATPREGRAKTRISNGGGELLFSAEVVTPGAKRARAAEVDDEPPEGKKQKLSAAEDHGVSVDVYGNSTADGVDGISFRVLRDGGQLRKLRAILSSDSDMSTEIGEFAQLHSRTLICFKLTPLNKGSPVPPCAIYAPTPHDVQLLRRHFTDPYGRGLPECVGPVEPKHSDPLREDRKRTTKENKRNRKLKAADRKRRKPETAPHRPASFPVAASREVVGCVTSGDFLFAHAQGGGVAFVTSHGVASLRRVRRSDAWLRELVESRTSSADGCGDLLALMRPVDSAQYRYVVLRPIAWD